MVFLRLMKLKIQINVDISPFVAVVVTASAEASVIDTDGNLVSTLFVGMSMVGDCLFLLLLRETWKITHIGTRNLIFSDVGLLPWLQTYPILKHFQTGEQGSPK